MVATYKQSKDYYCTIFSPLFPIFTLLFHFSFHFHVHPQARWDTRQVQLLPVQICLGSTIGILLVTREPQSVTIRSLVSLNKWISSSFQGNCQDPDCCVGWWELSLNHASRIGHHDCVQFLPVQFLTFVTALNPAVIHFLWLSRLFTFFPFISFFTCTQMRQEVAWIW